MKCKNCGNEFMEGMFCPECGCKYEEAAAAIPDDSAGKTNDIIRENSKSAEKANGSIHSSSSAKEVNKAQRKNDNRGIWSLILSIIAGAGFLTVILPLGCGIFSIIEGIKALKGKTKNKTCAILGIIFSSVAIALIILILVIPGSSSEETSSNENTVEVSADVETYQNQDTDDVDIQGVNLQNSSESYAEAEYEEIIDEEQSIIEEENEVAEEEDVKKDNEEEREEKKEKKDKNAAYTITIKIDYEKSSFSYNDDAIIYVDDVEIGNISAGDKRSFYVELKSGSHKIWVESDTKLRKNNSSKVKFKVSDDDLIFSFSLKDGSVGGLKLSKD